MSVSALADEPTTKENLLIEQIKKLFVHRKDTYATLEWKLNKKYNKKNHEDYKNEDRKYKWQWGRAKKGGKITDDLLLQHIRKEITIGVYTIDTDDTVKYLVFDIDGHKFTNPIKTSKAAQKKIRKHLKDKYNLNSYLEKSGSPNSYHVWVFIKPTKTKEVREFGIHVVSELGFELNKEIEIMPSVFELKNYGGFLKLPYGIHREKFNKTKKLKIKFLFQKYDDNPLGIQIYYKNIKRQFGSLYTINFQQLQIPKEIVEKIKKETKEKEEQNYDDKTLNGYLSKQLHCVDIAFNTHTSLVPEDFKFQAARGFYFEGASNEIVVEYFRNHPDYKRFITIEKAEEVRQEIIQEIYDEMLEDKKTRAKVKIDKKKIKKQIAVNLSNGYYKSRKTGCLEMKKICGDYIKNNICPISCEQVKIARSSARKLNSTSAIKGTIILSLKPIWKIINIEANRHKVGKTTYVNVSGDGLTKIIKEHPEFCIDSKYNFIKEMVFMEFLDISDKGLKTFTHSEYEGQKYRFKKDVIDEIINRKKR